MRVINRVLISKFNTFNTNKKIVNITKSKLESLLVEKYPVFLEDPSLDNLQCGIIDTTRTLGYVDNFRIEEDDITGVIKLYADFNITYTGNKHLEGDKEFYLCSINETDVSLKYIEGENILKIIGWVCK